MNEPTMPTAEEQPHASIIIDHKPSESQCAICQSPYSSSDMDMLDVCSQGHKFCQSCLKNFLISQITEFKGEGIRCPQESCTQKFNKNLIRSLLDEQSMKLYEAKKLEKMIGQNPNVKFCPKPGCSRVVQLSKSKRYSKCRCASKICNECGEFWHENLTCEQVRDVEFDTFVKANKIQPCMMCKTLVENVGTCPDMTCPVCDYHWCFTCGREKVGNHAAQCPKEYKPEPPQFVVNEPSEFQKFKTKTKGFLNYIKWLPVKFFCFGFYMCDIGDAFLSKNAGCEVRFQAFFFGVLISTIFVGGIIGLSLLAFVGLPERKDRTPGLTYLVVLFCVIFLVFIIYDARKAYLKGRPRANERWMFRDPKRFRIIRPKTVPINYIPITCYQRPDPNIRQRNAVDYFFDVMDHVEQNRATKPNNNS